MPRYIDANEIIKSEHQHYDYMSDEYYVLVRDIENAPTVDAVEVVRCKDCKHNYHNMIPSGEAEHGCTKCIELPITADFYCAWGEREEDDVVSGTN